MLLNYVIKCINYKYYKLKIGGVETEKKRIVIIEEKLWFQQYFNRDGHGGVSLGGRSWWNGTGWREKGISLTIFQFF
ncbi:hypothetical protein RclHR1_01970022 [Rhizophagus clarus]|uniref:Uncharacterized protein n=1 Tax=Rhizophagus clarus TaxID=94130 RepID=A0A2Z6QPY6_9GLOM|nr:hypothetical protein RclHR1_01970022 [Rhizophagus clarus]